MAQAGSPDDRYSVYTSPLVTRNASAEMLRIFSPRNRILIWRRLWLALAEAQKQLGLPISDGQIQALRDNLENIDFARAAEYERRFRHDVMAHIHAYADLAPQARAILHLGATSAFVADNADIVIMRDAMRLILRWLVNAIDAIAGFAERWKDLPCLGYTHFQPAQPTTVGKRACLWCWDFLRDLEEVQSRLTNLRLRGVKGTTGTQASFLQLFEGDAEKIARLERIVAEKMGFASVEPVTGQTYPRKVDSQVIGTLAQIAVSVHKFCNDIRLLSGLGELSEPFEAEQVGSSAMPYKRNPMRCERATGLARFVISLASSPLMTAAEQWLERTLDDSANRRLVLPESFLATDGMLRIVVNVARGLVVWPEVVRARLAEHLPFMASEAILMAAVKAGGDRQQLHERLRRHALAAAEQARKTGGKNDLIQRIRSDPAFAMVNLDEILDPQRFVGLAPQQTASFLREFVEPIRQKYADMLGIDASLQV